MNIEQSLKGMGLTIDNSVVIGSGILQALNLRQSADIDVIVSDADFKRLEATGNFTHELNHGRITLVDDILDVGTSWDVLGKGYSVKNLFKESVVINGVRYITLEFLLKVKERWAEQDNVPRQKDLDDIKLIKKYLS